MKRFRGGLVFKAHRLLHGSTLGSRDIKEKKIGDLLGGERVVALEDSLVQSPAPFTGLKEERALNPTPG